MTLRHYGLPAAFLLALTSAAFAEEKNAKEQDRQDPIVLEKSGGFVIGGKVIPDAKSPDKQLSCDHGYVE